MPNITRNLQDLFTWYLMYNKGYRRPRYPLPAIPLAVKYDYVGCVNIDDVTNPDDPVVVWLYDSWYQDNGEFMYGGGLPY